MNDNPLVSVLCSSFNHENFVGFFIESLQKQTYSNWELIIIDDCSTDNNVKEIEKYLSDGRIHFSKMDFNSGSGIVTGKAFLQSKGDIIVDCASDDALKNDYFETIVKTFKENENTGVIYSPLQIIDENNKYKEIRTLPDISQTELLRSLFYERNILYSPGIAIKREWYKTLVPMNFSLIQHQDYQWHIKLLLNTQCHLLSEPFVLYRVQFQESVSLGTRNFSANNRYNLEVDYLMNTFLSITDPKLAEDICNNNYKNFPKEVIPFVLGISILDSEDLQKRQWGYKTIMTFFENEQNLQLVHTLFNFEFKDMLNLSKRVYYIFPKEKHLLLKKTKSMLKIILRTLHLYNK